MKPIIQLTLLLLLAVLCLNVFNEAKRVGNSKRNLIKRSLNKAAALTSTLPSLSNSGTRHLAASALKNAKKMMKKAQSINSHLGSESLNVVKRTEWKARPAPHARRFASPPTKIIIHHTDSKNCSDKITCVNLLQEIQQYRMDVLGSDSIGYNFIIGGDGRVYEGLGWNLFTNLTETKHDPSSLQVAFIGDFEKKAPNDAQIRAYRKLQIYGDKKDYIKSYRIHAHRDIACTLCPGEHFYKVLKTWPRYKSISESTCVNSTLTSATCI